MPTKNLRHGRLTVSSGDSPTPLTRILAFTEGDFSYAITKNVNQILDRGLKSHLRKGDFAAITWSFTAKFVDRTLSQLLDEYVYDAEPEAATSLVAAALNSAVAAAFGFRQGSMLVTDSGFTKLAAGATPATEGEFSENVGAADIEEVVVATSYDVFMPTADTDLNFTTDAVGASTLDPAASDVKTFDLVFEVLDPGQPIPPGTVVETIQLDDATIEEITPLEEGDEFNTVSISGIAFIRRPVIAEQVTP